MAKIENKGKVLPLYQKTEHFNFCPGFTLDALKSALEYKPKPDDIFIVTYPKCGTTWMQNIVTCIFRSGKPFSSVLDFLTNTPFLEFAGAGAVKNMKRPGAMKVHLPFHLTPYSPETKYIFVARNPKDCCVSYYYHTKNLPVYEFEDGAFDDYFELFINGEVDFGDYFDTLLSWYEHKDDSNVLFLTYEYLKNNTEEAVLKVAEFLGPKYKESLSDPEMLKQVIYYSSFDYMKKFFSDRTNELGQLPRELILNNTDIPEGFRKLIAEQGNIFARKGENSQFVRKGIVGDWRNHFSKEQNQRLNTKFYEQTKGTDIPNLWKIEMDL